MNLLTQKLRAAYEPKMLITVYEATLPQSGKEREEPSANKYYLESHVVAADGTVMEGKPLRAETISAMVKAFFTKKASELPIGGLIPANMLRYDSLPNNDYRMIWYTPDQLRYLHFDEALNLPSGEANVPAMLWVARKNMLKVYALAMNVETSRPSEQTPLFKAPFYNTSAYGVVCLGSAKVRLPEKLTYEKLMVHWETIFFDSKFTHGVSHTVNNMNMVWLKLLTERALWSDFELVPNERCIGDILNERL